MKLHFSKSVVEILHFIKSIVIQLLNYTLLFYEVAIYNGGYGGKILLLYREYILYNIYSTNGLGV